MKRERAIILAAGRGLRLDRPDTPKPLVRVGNRPLIQWGLDHLRDSGIDAITVVTGHGAAQLRRELADRADLQLLAQRDGSSDGLLKSLLAAADAVAAPFYLTMADLILETNPYPLLRAAAEGLAPGTVLSLVGVERAQLARSGAQSQVRLDGERVVALGRELDAEHGLEVGIYRFDQASLTVARGVAAEGGTFAALMTRLVEAGQLQAVPYAGAEWFDVNTPSTCVRAEMFIRNRLRRPAIAPAARTLTLPSMTASFSRRRDMQTGILIRAGLTRALETVPLIPSASAGSTHFLITDDVVDPLYGERVLSGLTRAGNDVRKLVVPAGETSKTLDQAADLAGQIFAAGMDKQSYLVSLGGGVINNITGFLASTLYRGIGLIHIPTTTMAQVDAAIDFKQAVNSAVAKNLIGAYYPADVIAIDPEVLLTLTERDINNGLAESIKHALTQDAGFLSWLTAREGPVSDAVFLEEVVRRTVALKVPLLSGDVADDYNEMLPQYGHSVGHALEFLSSYELLHGEAIAIGMCVTAEIARLLGIGDDATTEAHYAVCQRYALPTIVPPSISAADVIDVIRYDKHYLHEAPQLALLQGVGQVWSDHGVHAAPVAFGVIRRAIELNKHRSER